MSSPIKVSVAMPAVALIAVTAMVTARHTSGDWNFFVGMSKALFGPDGTSVYGSHPNIQTGPLSLVAFRLLSIELLNFAWLRALVFLIIELVVIRALMAASARPLADQGRGGNTTFVISGVVLAFWWPFLAYSGHIDDALVLAIGASVFVLVARHRRIAAAVLIGIAIAVKPWAVLLIPLTIDLSSWRRRGLLAPLVSAGVGAALWSPFLLADARTLDGLRPTVRLAPDSVLRLLGLTAADLSPSFRSIQLVLATIAVAAGVLRSRPAAGLLAGFGVRLALDAGTWNYYGTGFIIAAALFECWESRSRVPWTVLVATACLAPAWVVPQPEVRAVLRLAACLLPVALVLWPRHADRARATTEHHNDHVRELIGVTS